MSEKSDWGETFPLKYKIANKQWKQQSFSK